MHTEQTNESETTTTTTTTTTTRLCYVAPENIHAHPKESLRKFQGGGGFQKPNFFERKYDTKMEFPEG